VSRTLESQELVRARSVPRRDVPGGAGGEELVCGIGIGEQLPEVALPTSSWKQVRTGLFTIRNPRCSANTQGTIDTRTRTATAGEMVTSSEARPRVPTTAVPSPFMPKSNPSKLLSATSPACRIRS
jgi:hypothetical protein